MGNIQPTPEQLKRAKEDFLFRSKHLTHQLNSIYERISPKIIYDFETNKIDISYQLTEFEEKMQKDIIQRIEDLKREIESNILSY